MEEFGLPDRLFQTGYEPTGRKRINNYFNLRWIEVVKAALTDTQQEMLAESQFRQIMLMGGHTFSVMFAHQLLSRQLVMQKLYELWWLLGGKPIRYGIGEFALVTGLNCGAPPTPSLGGQRMGKGKKKGKASAKQDGGDGVVWQSLFGSEDTITPEWILSKLGQKDKYKDEETRLRLSLLLLVEGILCPTSGVTQVRPEVVEMLGDIGMFLAYPWGRESFLLTVASGKIRAAGQLAQATLAIQGFAHAMVLVTVCSCPRIIADPRLGEDLVSEELPIEDIVDGVCARGVKINIVTVQTLELIGQAPVRSILYEGSDIPRFPDEVDDVRVNHMVSLIRDGFPFEINTWRGGVKAADAKHPRGVGGLGASTFEGGGQTGGNAASEQGEPSNTAGLPGGGGSGDHLDVSMLARLVAHELHARAVPMVETLKSGICAEIKALREVIMQTGTLESSGLDPHGPHNPVTTRTGNISGMQPPTVAGDQPRRSPEPQISPLLSVDKLPPKKMIPTSGDVPVAAPHDVLQRLDGTDVLMSTGTDPATASIAGVLAEITAGSSPTSTEREEGHTTGEAEATHLHLTLPVLVPPMYPSVEQLPTRTVGDDDSSKIDVTTAHAGLSANLHSLSWPNEGGTGEDVGDKVEALVPPHLSEQVPLADPHHTSPVQPPHESLQVSETEAPVVRRTELHIGGSVQTRASKRPRTPTVKYTPPAPPIKKQKGKKGGAREKKLSRKVPSIPASSSDGATTQTIHSSSVVQETQLPTIPETRSSETTTPTNQPGPFLAEPIVGPLVGEFSPCLRLNSFRLAGFCTAMHTPREYNVGEGVTVDNTVFRSLFDSSQTQPPKAADLVVTFIRRRLRGAGITSYDFLPASFVDSLRGEYQQFCRLKDISTFSFSNIFANPGFPNMKWNANVEVLYFPFQADKWQWIGVVVDISNWCIHVLDCNSACFTEAKLEALLNPIVVLMPQLIRLNGGKASPEVAMDSPMPITRLDLPLLCEQREYSCIASILLMELHASQNLAQAAHLNADALAIAGQTYAVEAFVTFHPEHLNEFPPSA